MIACQLIFLFLIISSEKLMKRSSKTSLFPRQDNIYVFDQVSDWCTESLERARKRFFPPRIPSVLHMCLWNMVFKYVHWSKTIIYRHGNLVDRIKIKSSTNLSVLSFSRKSKDLEGLIFSRLITIPRMISVSRWSILHQYRLFQTILRLVFLRSNIVGLIYY